MAKQDNQASQSTNGWMDLSFHIFCFGVTVQLCHGIAYWAQRSKHPTTTSKSNNEQFVQPVVLDSQVIFLGS
jgi:hypothetical protein